MKAMFKVIAQTQPVAVQKQDGSSIQKATIVIQELGGKYDNSFAATLLGNNATTKFTPGDVVWAALRFQAKDYHPKVNGVADASKTEYLQDIMVQEIVKMALDNTEIF
ncbi:MAG: hypothetical protein MR924_06160 [Prevotella sp.]|nr:hypothetical protein [Prevotella sp.]